jgi:hypothetical protein
MALRTLIGSNQLDAVAYVRGRMGDIGPVFRLPDATIAATIPMVATEFSRWQPLGHFQIGNAYPPYSSPLVTVAGQERYIINSGVLGALPPIQNIEEVEYLANLPMTNAGGEVPYNMLTTPYLGGAYGVDPGMPSSRIIRDFMRSEIDTYGVGFSDWGHDLAGNVFIDLYPIPTMSGTPIFVKYSAQHPLTMAGVDFTYPTVPDSYAKRWADLLWINLIEDNVVLFSRRGMVQAGLLRQSGDAKMALTFARQMRQELEGALGANTPVIERT